MNKTLDELLEEWEPERLAELARQDAIYNSPDAVARRAKQKAQEQALIDREIAEGIRRPDGSLIEDADEDEDEDDDQ